MSIAETGSMNNNRKLVFETLSTLYAQALWITQHGDCLDELGSSWQDVFGNPDWWKTELAWLEQKAELFGIDGHDLEKRANEKACWVESEPENQSVEDLPEDLSKDSPEDSIRAGLQDIADGRFREITSASDLLD